MDLPPSPGGPIRSSGQKAPGSSNKHVHVQEQLEMEELRNIWLQPTQARAGSIYSAMHSPPRGLTGCRLAHDAVFLKQHASFAQCSLQEDFGHRRWEINSHTHTHEFPFSWIIFSTGVGDETAQIILPCYWPSLFGSLQAAFPSRVALIHVTSVISTTTIFQDIFSEVSRRPHLPSR